MPDPTAPKLIKWPFLAGDLLLVAAALAIYAQSKLPLTPAELSLAVLCLVCGAALSIVPFLLEYRAAARLAEAGALTTVIAQIGQIEAIAAQISDATGRWATIHEEAEKTSAAAKGITERMTAEVKAFAEFMQRVNDSEKANLRLEVEKFRRGESEWLQVLVRILDHVYALHVGAVRSGQPNLIDQVTQFQNACRDAARRVGMTPFQAAADEPFDAKRHQVREDEEAPAEGAKVANTLATGYTFQGRILRPALVRLHRPPGPGVEPAAPREEPAQGGQGELR